MAENSKSTGTGSGRRRDMAYPDSLEAKEMFLAKSLSMSWQLALAVLIPIVGGYYLDGYLHSRPWLTLAGVVMALVLSIMIVWRTVAALPAYAKPKGKKNV